MGSQMRFIRGEPAVLLPGRVLVIADLHLGLENRLREQGINLPDQHLSLLQKLEKLVAGERAEKLIILGDVKEHAPNIDQEVADFFHSLMPRVPVAVVKGNHDGNIENVSGLEVHPASGMRYKNFALAHGHAYPAAELMQADYLLLAHQHAQIRLTDKAGRVYLEPAWLIAPFFKSRLREIYPKANPNLQAVFLPPFNPLLGGKALNIATRTPGNALPPPSYRWKRGRPARKGKSATEVSTAAKETLLGPLGEKKVFKLKRAIVFLMDGTCLGELGHIGGK